MNKENCIQALIKAVKEQGFKVQSLNLKHRDEFDFIKLELLRNRQAEPSVCKATDNIELNFESVQELCNKGTASKFLNVGDKLTIPHLYVNSCNGFDVVDLYNVNVIAVKVGKEEVLFNFENVLFTHSIDENYKVGVAFKSTPLGIYLQTIFAEGLSKSINVKVKDCSLLAYNNIFNNASDEYIEYFEPIKNRIKVFQKENDTAWWWLSTPFASDAAHFCDVHSDGDSGHGGASISFGGVVPAFLITAKEVKK